VIVAGQVVARRILETVGTTRSHPARLESVGGPGAARPVRLAHPSRPLWSLSTWCRRFVQEPDFSDVGSCRRT